MSKNNYLTIDVPVRPAGVPDPSRKTPTHVELSVYYSLGGYSGFTGKESPRGLYASATPVTIETTGGGFNVRGFLLFSGVKKLIDVQKRRADKRGVEVASAIKAQFDNREGPLWELLQHVLEEEGLVPAEGVAA